MQAEWPQSKADRRGEYFPAFGCAMFLTGAAETAELSINRHVAQWHIACAPGKRECNRRNDGNNELSISPGEMEI